MPPNPLDNLRDIQPYQPQYADKKTEALRDIVQGIVAPISQGLAGIDTITPLTAGIRNRELQKNTLNMAAQEKLLQLRRAQLAGELSSKANDRAEKESALQLLLGEQGRERGGMQLETLRKVKQLYDSGVGTEEQRTNWERMLMGAPPVNPRQVTVKPEKEKSTLERIEELTKQGIYATLRTQGYTEEDVAPLAATELAIWDDTVRADSAKEDFVFLGGAPSDFLKAGEMQIFQDQWRPLMLEEIKSAKDGKPGAILGTGVDGKKTITGRARQKKFLEGIQSSLGRSYIDKLRKENPREWEFLVRSIAEATSEYEPDEVTRIIAPWILKTAQEKQTEETRNIQKELTRRMLESQGLK